MEHQVQNHVECPTEDHSLLGFISPEEVLTVGGCKIMSTQVQPLILSPMARLFGILGVLWVRKHS